MYMYLISCLISYTFHAIHVTVFLIFESVYMYVCVYMCI